VGVGIDDLEVFSQLGHVSIPRFSESQGSHPHPGSIAPSVLTSNLKSGALVAADDSREVTGGKCVQRKVASLHVDPGEASRSGRAVEHR
jgi:hypothetical protein